MTNRPFALLLLSLACFCPSALFADRPATSGIIDLDAEVPSGDGKSSLTGQLDVNVNADVKKKVDPYQVAQDNSISYFKNFEKALSAGGGAQPAIGSAELLHLNGLYLYCTLQNGTCPEVLDAILEIDIFNSSKSGAKDCPIMKSFWKSWIANNLEKRHQHGVKIGQMDITTDFKRNVLPKYLRCSATVQDELSKNPASKRYGSGSLAKGAVTSTVQKLEHLKQTVPDVFAATE
jgi:hypothetical protein